MAIACAMREAPEPQAAPKADLSQIESVTLAGSFNSWSASATPMEESEPGVWSATVDVGNATPVEFKFVGNENWDLSVGEADQGDARFPVSGVAEPGGQAGNIQAYLPAAGSYRFEFTLDGLAYGVSRVDEPAVTNEEGP